MDSLHHQSEEVSVRVVPHAAECGHTKPSAVVCCTTGKKQNGSRRRRYRPANDDDDDEDEGAPGYGRRGTLKPYNAYTPLSELRQASIVVSGSGTSFCNSFEANQSFPLIGRRRPGPRFAADPFASGGIRRFPRVSFNSSAKMDRVRVDGSNGVRFTAFRPKGGCYPHPHGGVASPYNGSSYIASTSESIGRLPKSDINPNKAVFTIDSKTSQILIVNRNACELLGYNSRELCEMEFTSLLFNKNKMHVSALAEGQLNSEDGTVIILSGKVVELCTKYDKNVAVSLWVRQIDTEGQRCLAVAEPVERRVAQLVVDKSGYIVSGDHEALMLFQLDAVEKFNGMDITLLIPAIQLPDADSSLIAKHIRKQKATGKTQDGVSFPLCLMIAHYESGTDTTDSGLSNPNALLYLVTIWVYTNLSGLLVIDENSIIESCNHHFSMLMFGFPQSKTIGEHISKLIPNIGQDSDCLTRSRNATLSSLDNDESETETDHVELECNREGGGFSMQCGPVNGGGPRNCVPCYDLVSPAKEPRVKVCLDFTVGSNSGGRSMYSSSLAAENMAAADLQSSSGGTNNEAHGKAPNNTEQESVEASFTVDPSSLDEARRDSQCSMLLPTEGALYLEENSENNPNYGNTSVSLTGNNGIKFSTSSMLPTMEPVDGNKKTTTNSTGVAAVATPATAAVLAASEDYTSLTDCDLLTPVNENSVCMNLLNSTKNGGSMNDTKSGHYATMEDQDISLALLKDSLATPASAPPVLVTPRLVKPYELTTKTTSIVTSTPDPAQQHKRHSVAGGGLMISEGPAPGGRQSVGGGGNTTKGAFVAYRDGKYRGEAIHYDGNVIDIIYTISNQMLPCGRRVYCIWISRDPESSYNHLDDANVTLTFNSITSTIDNSVGPSAGLSKTGGGAGGGSGVAGGAATGAIANGGAPGQSTSRPGSVSLVSQCEEEQVYGEYNKHYTTIKQIGKGAYGYVKLSYRNSDRLLVISKFILKEKLCSNFMIATEDKKEIPMEIYLLTHVKHPNIVTVFDVFENEKFFQLVMEVHGSGMDLFEFIDRRPAMTEKLGCYIFRQIANAVDYLHSMNILHRDIKDENIIIDQHFHVKLIDFGSATFMQEGKLFSTFYGTTEYCSPEVLAGNKYAGPELEMWSLGVTLYVLMFFENPFLDIEETLKSDLIIPQEISAELEYVLLALLDKNPKTRITMKQLIASEWLTQEINPSVFNFALIIPCEPYEVNPEKYYNGQIYSSQTGLSTSPHSLSLVDDEGADDDEENGEDGDDDEEHAHIEDFSVDPEELLEDDVCPLSHDDDVKADRRTNESRNESIDTLVKTVHRFSLQEPHHTEIAAGKASPLHAGLPVSKTVDELAAARASMSCPGKSDPCLVCIDHPVPLGVPSFVSSSGKPVSSQVSKSYAGQQQPATHEVVATHRVDGERGQSATGACQTIPPTALLPLLPLHETSGGTGGASSGNRQASNQVAPYARHSLGDSSCSTTPSLAMPPSAMVCCIMPPYSVLPSGDSCSCSSVNTLSSSCSIDCEHQAPYPCGAISGSESSSAAETPTNYCSQELLQPEFAARSARARKCLFAEASTNLLQLDVGRHYAASSSSTSPCSSLTSSKSENNIFDGKFATFSTIYDVVSMDNVTDATAAMMGSDVPVILPFHGYAINDLSRALPSAVATAAASTAAAAAAAAASAAPSPTVSHSASSGSNNDSIVRGWRATKK
ncbi:uncharacterized protein LOC126576789 [Anopheles aquasalis]|uniref:uncharacterized protein LOC126576789 n=1 Tax=Anopheles aquasalis TaxID=42839 RepID=UPI00215B5B0A|nr:uncharacterized protein LOC126576789 [Anopheles aquasalis]